MQLGARRASNRTKLPHHWAVMFPDLCGLRLELPRHRCVRLSSTRSCLLRVGTTANHFYASMMGVYGMLAIAFAVFGLRYLLPRTSGREKGLVLLGL